MEEPVSGVQQLARIQEAYRCPKKPAAHEKPVVPTHESLKSFRLSRATAKTGENQILRSKKYVWLQIPKPQCTHLAVVQQRLGRGVANRFAGVENHKLMTNKLASMSEVQVVDHIT